eukprot:TRINITY_DN15383_c0_g1_i1.p1 TRINITY_DN15383_c0_g1~~TRINITY_DN15383_c0_g1_i1.p1  ORF type:complete len:156 (+),score=30.00 TRINITY_DN15383_c0_g1_i1:234-701(+)
MTQCCDVRYFKDEKIVLNPEDITEEGLLKIRIFAPSTAPSNTIHSVTQAVGHGLRPIHIAAAFGHVEVLDTLLESDEKKVTIDYNAGRGYAQFTPLLFAVVNNQAECAKLLLIWGANPKLDDGWGTKPIDWAKKMKNREMEDIFLYREKNSHMFK